MKCYFCNTNLGEPDRSNFILTCPICYESNEEYVRHTIVSNELWFVEIFTMVGKIQYVVTLSVRDNKTFIDTYEDHDKESIVLQGFSINFSNVKNKLKTYLLFS